jgi:aspartyl-tRNA(Asn)/glutamyl-tRNA(Gln) amidotransferase subunit A
LPCGISASGLPIGLQLQAPALEEERLLRGARMFEQATEWHKQRATL